MQAQDPHAHLLEAYSPHNRHKASYQNQETHLGIIRNSACSTESIAQPNQTPFKTKAKQSSQTKRIRGTKVPERKHKNIRIRTPKPHSTFLISRSKPRASLSSLQTHSQRQSPTSIEAKNLSV